MRELLAIPKGREVYFYRYSDSAGEWILLDPNSSPVYKQLFRAAKAKLKLRIKVTTPEGHGKKSAVIRTSLSLTFCTQTPQHLLYRTMLHQPLVSHETILPLMSIR
jgi:hypothetical protein